MVVIAYEDGDVEVRCNGGYSGCKYRSQKAIGGIYHE